MIKIINKFIIPLITISSIVSIARSEALKITPEAKMNVRITISETDGQFFTLTNATYEVLAEDDTVVTSSTDATISGSMLIGLADASTWTADSSYIMIFRHEIEESTAELYYWRVDIDCSEDAIQ